MEQATLEVVAGVITRKPIHESLVDVISGARSHEELTTLGMIILKTKFPKGFPEIRVAWITKTDELHYGPNFAGQVLADIDTQEMEVTRDTSRREREKEQLAENKTPATLEEIPDERESIAL